MHQYCRRWLFGRARRSTVYPKSTRKVLEMKLGYDRVNGSLSVMLGVMYNIEMTPISVDIDCGNNSIVGRVKIQCQH